MQAAAAAGPDDERRRRRVGVELGRVHHAAEGLLLENRVDLADAHLGLIVVVPHHQPEADHHRGDRHRDPAALGEFLDQGHHKDAGRHGEPAR